MRNAANPDNGALPDLEEQTQRFRVKPHALAIHPRFRRPSMNQLYDQVEAQDTACRALTATSSITTVPTPRHASSTTSPDGECL